MKWTLVAGLLVFLLACAPAESPQPVAAVEPVFVDATAESGLDYAFDRARGGGHFMPDSLAGGCALFDYDADGDLDVYAVLGLFVDGAVHPDGANRLFRQDPDGSFTDVSAASGADHAGYGMGVAVGDIDNDGDADLFVSNYGPDAMLRNNGDGTFSDVTESAGVGDPRWGASTGFFDFDGDGWLDLFVSNYLQYEPGPDIRDSAGRPEYAGPDCCPGTADILYRNNGDGTFRDVSHEVGIAEILGKGLGVAFTDLDGDGRTDIFVANDGEANRAWVRDGDGLRDAAGRLGVGLNGFGGAEASMGVVVADLNGDFRDDLFLTHLFQETNTLYLAGEGERYVDATFGSGLGKQSNDLTGFGAAALDIDADGRPELAVVNGRVLRRAGRMDGGGHWRPYEEPNLLFWNDGAGRFRQAGDECAAFCDVGVGRGLAAGDIDNDGDTDLLVTTADGRLHLKRNVYLRDGHWLGLRLIDTRGPRDGTGAAVELLVSGRTLRATVAPAQSYLSSHDPRVLFRLGASESIDGIRVTWPDGTVEAFDADVIDGYHDLVRGKGNGA